MLLGAEITPPRVGDGLVLRELKLRGRVKRILVVAPKGLVRQWQAEMQTLVDSYKCEWKEVVDNPALRQRFAHFWNAPGKKDPTVAFDSMRGQIKAKEW